MSNAINKSKRSFILKCFIAAFIILVLIGLAAKSFRGKETWPRLQQIDPSLSILKEPSRLMKVASIYTQTNLAIHSGDVDSTVEVRHEAVLALLNLQETQWGVHISSPAPKGTGIDHVCVFQDQAPANVFLRLIATPSKDADIHASEGNYWSMEQLDFNQEGRLISRTAYHQP